MAGKCILWRKGQQGTRVQNFPKIVNLKREVGDDGHTFIRGFDRPVKLFFEVEERFVDGP